MEPADGSIEIATGGEDGVLRYERVGVLPTPWGRLTLFWLAAYGGGLFLPFRDATCGKESYGAGRYLTDTVKGTHGRGVAPEPDGRVRLDFNYAYNPSLRLRRCVGVPARAVREPPRRRDQRANWPTRERPAPRTGAGPSPRWISYRRAALRRAGGCRPRRR